MAVKDTVEVRCLIPQLRRSRTLTMTMSCYPNADRDRAKRCDHLLKDMVPLLQTRKGPLC